MKFALFSMVPRFIRNKLINLELGEQLMVKDGYGGPPYVNHKFDHNQVNSFRFFFLVQFFSFWSTRNLGYEK